MTLKVIEIENVKGIKKHSYFLEILPNKPSILVAPNGFGKSSFATAFNGLQPDRYIVKDELLSNHPIKNLSRLFIKYQTKDNRIIDLQADHTVNTINDQFDCFVINNLINAKGTGTNYGSEITITPVILIDEIPEKVRFQYSVKNQRRNFGLNGKILPNLKPILSEPKLIKKINENIIVFEASLTAQIQYEINRFIDKVNQQKGPSSYLIEWIENNELNNLNSFDTLSHLTQVIYEFNVFTSKTECFLAVIQLISLFKVERSDFKKACEYKVFELEKEYYKSLLGSFNPSGRSVRIKESYNRLLVEFPDFYTISNGERDILCFIALLERAKRKLKKSSNILIIDEVFDYLDEANLIAAQYYITQFIDDFRIRGKRIYPLILTHLDPTYFKNFIFNKQRIYYLDKSKVKVNKSLVNLLLKRNDPSIKDDVSKYLFHFHPNPIDKRLEFKALSLKETWGEHYSFDIYINKETTKYLDRNAEYEPFAVCCALRKRIEKIIYKKMESIADKAMFLDTHTTLKKLKFAEGLAMDVPEVYYLLSIIYNEGMHWKHDEDNVSRIASKLENQTIRYLIEGVFG